MKHHGYFPVSQKKNDIFGVEMQTILHFLKLDMAENADEYSYWFCSSHLKLYVSIDEVPPITPEKIKFRPDKWNIHTKQNYSDETLCGKIDCNKIYAGYRVYLNGIKVDEAWCSGTHGTIACDRDSAVEFTTFSHRALNIKG